MAINDLVMNVHKGALRFGTVTSKRIDEAGWAQFEVEWHADEAHEESVEWNVSMGNKRSKYDLGEYRTDMLQILDVNRMERVLANHRNRGKIKNGKT
tara:strand:+ start:300 stop:590 length:291 start_codon:yes stop_codon:yes gene_type:complete